jgi:hypothetical protein
MAVLAATTLAVAGPAAAPEPVGGINLTTAGKYLHEFDRLCRKDSGRLWSVSLCGPTLFVEPETREAVGSRADATGRLRLRKGVFVGTLPEDTALANTSMEWAGTRWTMIMWSALDENKTERLRLMAHEAFHRIQPELHLDPTGELNAHLDTADGRFWLQLEWNALQSALLAKDTARGQAVADALTFRAARRARFPESAGREVPLEIFEGLAEYTGMKLAGFSGDQVVEAALQQRRPERGFVRSFAYVSGPLYGYLLDATKASWRQNLKADTDLGALLGASMRVTPGPPDDATRRAAGYDGAALRASEDEREVQRQARLAAWRVSLVDGPVLVIDLGTVTSGSFDPRAVFPFGDKQTVYGTRDLIGEWGSLHVEGGAVLEDWNTQEAHVALDGSDTDGLSGKGWSLKLNDGWEVVAGARAGDRAVRRIESR